MARFNFIVNTAVCLLGIQHASAYDDPSFEQSCADLKQTYESENVTPLFSEAISAGSHLVVPDLDPSCANSTTVPVDLCRLGLNVTTSDRSDVIMEVWLPRDWSGRFLSTGNGGINGCVDYRDLSYAASLGFAATGSNNGHSGQNGTRFLNNLEVVKDYSYRALTTSAAVGKDVTAKFYDKPHKKAYYLGCSTGGRQGFKMAQDFPDIFDGIVAGAPAFNFQGLNAWSGRFHTIIKEVGPDGMPPESTWAAVDEELLAQCDHLDGAIDGILEDPSLCNFRPEALICPEGNNSNNTAANASNNTTANASNNTATNATCITGKQAETIRRFLSPVHGVNGTFVYPRLEPVPGFLAFLSESYDTDEQFLYTDHWAKYAVYNDSSYDTTYLGPEEWEYAFQHDPSGVRTWSGDLSGVEAAGTKVLHYHGLGDPLISSASSTTYYNMVSRTMGMPSTDLDEFYRYFRISGMGHCSGGSGATAIGNGRDAGGIYDPADNVLMAMVQWVEEGVAPESIVGSKLSDDEENPEVEYKRSHCKYPLRNVLKEGGDDKSADDWNCV